MEKIHGAIHTKENNKPLLMPKMPDTILGKRKGNQNESKTDCEKCGLEITSERELRLHNAIEHITEKHVTVGTKRDESFIARSDSFSPVRKGKIMEVASANTGKKIIEETMNKADSHPAILTHEPKKTTVNPEDLKEHNDYPDQK